MLPRNNQLKKKYRFKPKFMHHNQSKNNRSTYVFEQKAMNEQSRIVLCVTLRTNE